MARGVQNRDFGPPGGFFGRGVKNSKNVPKSSIFGPQKSSILTPQNRRFSTDFGPPKTVQKSSIFDQKSAKCPPGKLRFNSSLEFFGAGQKFSSVGSEEADRPYDFHPTWDPPANSRVALRLKPGVLGLSNHNAGQCSAGTFFSSSPKKRRVGSEEAEGGRVRLGAHGYLNTNFSFSPRKSFLRCNIFRGATTIPLR